MKIRLNGSERETASATVAHLLTELHLPPQTVLIECNGLPLRRDEWDAAPLRDGDAIEVLRISAGG
ncbi:MAG: sulfur carrier protein ThiS [Chthoniobacteraceae bacterium]|jgi:thiamine biosynthesis protein ThiS